MLRWMSVIAALCAAMGCGPASTESKVADTPTKPAAAGVSADAFAGTWRCVTPSLEFIGLTVVSKSSQQGVLGARLTLSGVYWEGSGRIDADSLVASMTVVGASAPGAVLVARARDALTLRVQMQRVAGAAPAAPLDLTFVRDD
jgi:hypothetical protein